MKNANSAAAQGWPSRADMPPFGRSQDHDSKAWIVRTLIGVVMLPLMGLDFLFISLSPMATDSCGPDHCSDALNDALLAAPVVWLIALVLLIVTLALPSRTRFRDSRLLTGILAVTGGFATLAILANLPTG
ncbi:hypothetical protein AB0K89_18150 [Streptomyces cinnamoneus]|uniref:hypothetical protein n=1 Tax=Streptomyces cinnamoneus TaxID=53446 RepID=UPI00342818F9